MVYNAHDMKLSDAQALYNAKLYYEILGIWVREE